MTKKKLKGYIDAEEIEFGEVRDDNLSYREKQSKIDNSLINRNPTTALGDRDPLAYLTDKVVNAQGGTNGVLMGTLEDGVRKVISSMIPPQLIELNESMGYDNPLTTMVMNDSDDTITFSFGGEEVTMDFGSSRDANYIYSNIEDTIEDGIKKMNVKRRRGDIDTQSTYDEWKIDQVSNPTGDTTLAGYIEWLNSN